MFKDRATLAKEVRAVKIARWEGFRRLAKLLPNHHVLGVELIRTRNDETAAVFTVVRNHEPVQTIVRGDANGRVKIDDCGPRQWMMATDAYGPEDHDEGHGPEAQALGARSAAKAVDDTGADPDDFAFGGPPPKQPPEPGIIAVGTVLLAAAFNLAEQVPPASEK